MSTFHITEPEAARDFAELLAKVRGGTDVLIESGNEPIAILRASSPQRRSFAECIARLPANSTATIDEDFSKDVEAAIASRNEPMIAPEWG
jgi:antitoxin (DNA-binding transcriptional repressor) of toxin-antitoxin stability system